MAVAVSVGAMRHMSEVRFFVLKKIINKNNNIYCCYFPYMPRDSVSPICGFKNIYILVRLYLLTPNCFLPSNCLPPVLPLSESGCPVVVALGVVVVVVFLVR